MSGCGGSGGRGFAPRGRSHRGSDGQGGPRGGAAAPGKRPLFRGTANNVRGHRGQPNFRGDGTLHRGNFNGPRGPPGHQGSGKNWLANNWSVKKWPDQNTNNGWPHNDSGNDWCQRGGVPPSYPSWRGGCPPRFNGPPPSLPPPFYRSPGPGTFGPPYRFPPPIGAANYPPLPPPPPLPTFPSEPENTRKAAKIRKEPPHPGSEEERRQKISEVADKLKRTLSSIVKVPDASEAWCNEDDVTAAPPELKDSDRIERMANRGIPELKHDPPELDLTLNDLRDIGRVDHDHANKTARACNDDMPDVTIIETTIACQRLDDDKKDEPSDNRLADQVTTDKVLVEREQFDTAASENRCNNRLKKNYGPAECSEAETDEKPAMAIGKDTRLGGLLIEVNESAKNRDTTVMDENHTNVDGKRCKALSKFEGLPFLSDDSAMASNESEKRDECSSESRQSTRRDDTMEKISAIEASCVEIVPKTICRQPEVIVLDNERIKEDRKKMTAESDNVASMSDELRDGTASRESRRTPAELAQDLRDSPGETTTSAKRSDNSCPYLMREKIAVEEPQRKKSSDGSEKKFSPEKGSRPGVITGIGPDETSLENETETSVTKKPIEPGYRSEELTDAKIRERRKVAKKMASENVAANVKCNISNDTASKKRAGTSDVPNDRVSSTANLVEFDPKQPPPSKAPLDVRDSSETKLPPAFDPRLSSRERSVLLSASMPVKRETQGGQYAPRGTTNPMNYARSTMRGVLVPNSASTLASPSICISDPYAQILPPMGNVPPPVMLPPPMLLPNNLTTMQPPLPVLGPPPPPPPPALKSGPAIDMDAELEDMQEAMKFAKSVMRESAVAHDENDILDRDISDEFDLFHMPTFPDLPPIEPPLMSKLNENANESVAIVNPINRTRLKEPSAKRNPKSATRHVAYGPAPMPEEYRNDAERDHQVIPGINDEQLRPKVVFNLNSKIKKISKHDEWLQQQQRDETEVAVKASTNFSSTELLLSNSFSEETTKNRKNSVPSKEKSRLLNGFEDHAKVPEERTMSYNGEVSPIFVRNEKKIEDPASPRLVMHKKNKKSCEQQLPKVPMDKSSILTKLSSKEESPSSSKRSNEFPSATESSWKSRVIGRFLKMSKNDIRNMLNNASLRKFDIAMKHLVKEHRSSLSLEMRSNEEERMRDAEASYNREEFMDQLSAMLDPSATVDLGNLPTQFIQHLSQVLHLEPMSELETSSLTTPESSRVVSSPVSTVSPRRPRGDSREVAKDSAKLDDRQRRHRQINVEVNANEAILSAVSVTRFLENSEHCHANDKTSVHKTKRDSVQIRETESSTSQTVTGPRSTKRRRSRRKIGDHREGVSSVASAATMINNGNVLAVENERTSLNMADLDDIFTAGIARAKKKIPDTTAMRAVGIKDEESGRTTPRIDSSVDRVERAVVELDEIFTEGIARAKLASKKAAEAAKTAETDDGDNDDNDDGDEEIDLDDDDENRDDHADDDEETEDRRIHWNQDDLRANLNAHRLRQKSSRSARHSAKHDKWSHRKNIEEPATFRNLTKEEWEARYGESSYTSHRREHHLTQVPREERSERDVGGVRSRLGEPVASCTEFRDVDDSANYTRDRSSDEESSSTTSTLSDSSDHDGGAPSVAKLLKVIKEREKIAKHKSLNEEIRDEVAAEIERKKRERTRVREKRGTRTKKSSHHRRKRDKRSKEKKRRERKRRKRKSRRSDQRSREDSEDNDDADEEYASSPSRGLNGQRLLNADEIKKEIVIKEEITLEAIYTGENKIPCCGILNTATIVNSRPASTASSSSISTIRVATPIANSQPKTKAQLKQMPVEMSEKFGSIEVNDEKKIVRAAEAVKENRTIIRLPISAQTGNSKGTNDAGSSTASLVSARLGGTTSTAIIETTSTMVASTPTMIATTATAVATTPTAVVTTPTAVAMTPTAIMTALSAFVTTSTAIPMSSTAISTAPTGDPTSSKSNSKKLDINAYKERARLRQQREMEKIRLITENPSSLTQNLLNIPLTRKKEAEPAERTLVQDPLQDPRRKEKTSPVISVNCKALDASVTVRDLADVARAPILTFEASLARSNYDRKISPDESPLTNVTAISSATATSTSDRPTADTGKFARIKSEGGKEMKLREKLKRKRSTGKKKSLQTKNFAAQRINDNSKSFDANEVSGDRKMDSVVETSDNLRTLNTRRDSNDSELFEIAQVSGETDIARTSNAAETLPIMPSLDQVGNPGTTKMLDVAQNPVFERAKKSWDLAKNPDPTGPQKISDPLKNSELTDAPITLDPLKRSNLTCTFGISKMCETSGDDLVASMDPDSSEASCGTPNTAATILDVAKIAIPSTDVTIAERYSDSILDNREASSVVPDVTGNLDKSHDTHNTREASTIAPDVTSIMEKSQNFDIPAAKSETMNGTLNLLNSSNVPKMESSDCTDIHKDLEDVSDVPDIKRIGNTSDSDPSVIGLANGEKSFQRSQNLSLVETSFQVSKVEKILAADTISLEISTPIDQLPVWSLNADTMSNAIPDTLDHSSDGGGPFEGFTEAETILRRDRILTEAEITDELNALQTVPLKFVADESVAEANGAVVAADKVADGLDASLSYVESFAEPRDEIETSLPDPLGQAIFSVESEIVPGEIGFSPLPPLGNDLDEARADLGEGHWPTTIDSPIDETFTRESNLTKTFDDSLSGRNNVCNDATGVTLAKAVSNKGTRDTRVSQGGETDVAASCEQIRNQLELTPTTLHPMPRLESETAKAREPRAMIENPPKISVPETLPINESLDKNTFASISVATINEEMEESSITSRDKNKNDNETKSHKDTHHSSTSTEQGNKSKKKSSRRRDHGTSTGLTTKATLTDKMVQDAITANVVKLVAKPSASRDTVMARMMEIDVEIHKLMNEKMTLYKMLESGDFSCQESPSIVDKDKSDDTRIVVERKEKETSPTRNVTTPIATENEPTDRVIENPKKRKRSRETKYRSKDRDVVVETGSRERKHSESGKSRSTKSATRETNASTNSETTSMRRSREKSASFTDVEAINEKGRKSHSPFSQASSKRRNAHSTSREDLASYGDGDHKVARSDTSGHEKSRKGKSSNEPKKRKIGEDRDERRSLPADYIYSDESTRDSQQQQRESIETERDVSTGLTLLEESFKREVARHRMIKSAERTKRNRRELRRSLLDPTVLTPVEARTGIINLLNRKKFHKRRISGSKKARTHSIGEDTARVWNHVSSVIDAVAKNRVDELYTVKIKDSPTEKTRAIESEVAIREERSDKDEIELHEDEKGKHELEKKEESMEKSEISTDIGKALDPKEADPATEPGDSVESPVPTVEITASDSPKLQNSDETSIVETSTLNCLAESTEIGTMEENVGKKLELPTMPDDDTRDEGHGESNQPAVLPAPASVKAETNRPKKRSDSGRSSKSRSSTPEYPEPARVDKIVEAIDTKERRVSGTEENTEESVHRFRGWHRSKQRVKSHGKTSTNGEHVRASSPRRENPDEERDEGRSRRPRSASNRGNGHRYNGHRERAGPLGCRNSRPSEDNSKSSVRGKKRERSVSRESEMSRKRSYHSHGSTSSPVTYARSNRRMRKRPKKRKHHGKMTIDEMTRCKVELIDCKYTYLSPTMHPKILKKLGVSRINRCSFEATDEILPLPALTMRHVTPSPPTLIRALPFAPRDELYDIVDEIPARLETDSLNDVCVGQQEKKREYEEDEDEEENLEDVRQERTVPSVLESLAVKENVDEDDEDDEDDDNIQIVKVIDENLPNIVFSPMEVTRLECSEPDVLSNVADETARQSNNLETVDVEETFDDSTEEYEIIDEVIDESEDHDKEGEKEAIEDDVEILDEETEAMGTKKSPRFKCLSESVDEIRDDNDNEPRRTRYTVHKGPILDIKVLDDSFLAASEDGAIYRYSQTSNGILNIYKGHEAAVTCIYVLEMPGKRWNLYSGSLDGTFRCYDIMTGLQDRSVDVESPVQCMDQSWGTIYIGTKSGHISRYNIKSGSLKGDRLDFSDKSVLALKASIEGPRKVLIVASRNQPITIRDANTGLFLRTICGYKNHTVYSLMRDRNLVYCGTSSTSIPVYDFTNGEQVTQYNAGVGIVCMRLYRQVLFAGCYDGNIYVFDTKETKLLCSIPGPGNMLLSMEVVDDEIIAGSKNRQLHSWRMPKIVRALLAERT